MAFCGNCGNQVADEIRFCSTCGTPTATRERELAVVGGYGSVAAAATEAPVASLASPAALATPAAVGGSTASGVQLNPTINVNVSQTQAPQQNTVVVVNNQGDHSLFVRALWFVFFGLWFGGIWMTVAWFLNVTIIGLPLGLMMINRVPQVMTLKRSTLHTTVVVTGNTTVIQTGVGTQQYSFLVRAVYFLLVGWWFSAVWMTLSWLFSALLITLPVAFWMFDRVPTVTTLRLN